MNILVTGNQGYVGSVLAPHLKQALGSSACLTGLDNGYFESDWTVPLPFEDEGISHQIKADIRDVTRSLLNGFDVVVHLAAVSNDPIGSKFEAATNAINLQATIDIAKLAKKAGVRHFVFASSCSVYGAAEGTSVAEDGCLAPQTAYARSKVSAEQELADMAGNGFQVTCLRFATACGFSPRLRLDLVINDFVASAVATGEIVLKSEGNAWRPFIAVSDMARAIEWAIVRDGNACEIVNAGHPQLNIRISELAELVGNEIGNVTVRLDEGAQPDKRSYNVDFSRFLSLAPDHQPRESFSHIVAGLSGGLRQVGFADKEFRRGNLIRLNRLSGYLASKQISPDLRWMVDAD